MSSDVQDVLHALGLTLHDRGNQWRARPPYRASNNETSLVIYKDNGAFQDFGAGIRGSLRDLIKLLTGLKTQDEVENFLKTLKYEEDAALIRKPKLSMPTTFKTEAVQNLLPHYSFYVKRGISVETLEALGGGMAGEGLMVRRYVFPIWDEHKRRILGYAGRDLTNSQRAKWKLLGSKRYWTYPLFLTLPYILEKREVILVESIGDFLALWEAGIRNVLVIFGIDLPHYFDLFNRIVSLNPRRILIALNNDIDSDKNNGQLGAEKISKSLSKVFDPRQLVIAPPDMNDFGVMNKTQIQNWYGHY